jgi:hypothetical protein
MYKINDALPTANGQKPKAFCSDFYYINPGAFFRLGIDFQFCIFKIRMNALLLA